MKAINIILDTTDSQNPIFVEIEDDEGKSINCGEWIKRTKDGIIQAMRITHEDLYYLLGFEDPDLLSISNKDLAAMRATLDKILNERKGEF